MIVPILKIGKNLIISIQISLTDKEARQFEQEVLDEVARTEASGIIIDISAVDVVDSYMARILSETSTSATVMGANAVIVGMRPDIALTLVHMGRGLQDVATALNLEHGLAKLDEMKTQEGGQR